MGSSPTRRARAVALSVMRPLRRKIGDRLPLSSSEINGPVFGTMLGVTTQLVGVREALPSSLLEQRGGSIPPWSTKA